MTHDPSRDSHFRPLQVEVSNVHVRYEDDSSGAPFAFGFKLDSLSLRSVCYVQSISPCLCICLTESCARMSIWQAHMHARTHACMRAHTLSQRGDSDTQAGRGDGTAGAGRAKTADARGLQPILAPRRHERVSPEPVPPGLARWARQRRGGREGADFRCI